MGEKKLGEDGVYAAFRGSTKSAYTIIRPGGLEEPKENVIQGPAALEVSQGDVVRRADMPRTGRGDTAAATRIFRRDPRPRY